MKFNTVLILGNSITQHPPEPTIGWYGNWGMAASAEDKDFVHILSRKVKKVNHEVKVLSKNVADFERRYWEYDLRQLDDLKALKPDLIILRLGENVDSLTVAQYSFKRHYAGLINYFRENNQEVKILNASSFWKIDAVESQIKQVATETNTDYISLSHLSAEVSNMAYAFFTDPGVGYHPSDKGMTAIAQTIWEKIEVTYRENKAH